MMKLPGLDASLDIYDHRYEREDDDMGRDTARSSDIPPTNVPDDRIHDDARHWWLTRRTRLEMAMLSVVNTIMNKTGWQDKIQRDRVRERWSNEIEQVLRATINEIMDLSTEDADDRPGFMDEQLTAHASLVAREAAKFCVEELLHRAVILQNQGLMSLLDTCGGDVVFSDDVVSEDLRVELRSLAGALEAGQTVPEWHPGQEGVVRDLIHPSTCPLQYGQTRVIKTGRVALDGDHSESGAEPVRLGMPAPVENYSTRFQWLPAEVDIASGTSAFTSYINNLDYRRHAYLYEAIAQVIDCAIPLWEKCMAAERIKAPRRVPCNDEASTYLVPDTSPEPAPRDFVTVNRYSFSMSHTIKAVGRVEAERIRDERWAEKLRRPSCPAPTSFEEYSSKKASIMPPSIDLRRRYKRLQVIVKMSNVHLTPENPRYQGGSWHVEGLANEHICATAIYYYDCENVEDVAVNFRAGAVMDSIEYEQDAIAGLERVYGAKLQGGVEAAIQDLPAIVTRQGRLMTFPNVFQHLVPPFRLRDATRPGHRKILVLWLVNPQKRIISTEIVPRQQQPDETATAETRGEMRRLQRELMAERSPVSNSYGSITRRYNFCEH